jgi:biopolymer transport protein ExbB
MHRRPGGWVAYKTITIDHTKCGTANTTNYPFLFNSTVTALKSLANGGSVTDANGFAFYADSGLTTLLDFEVESWSATTGALIAWVRIPTLTFGSDVVLYLAYGSSAISLQNATGVWESSFHGVWHLGTGLGGYSASARKDSTANGNTLSNGASFINSATGIVGDCLSMGANGLGASDNATTRLTSAFTVEAWCLPTSFTGFRTIASKGTSTIRNYEIRADQTTGKPVVNLTQGASNFKSVTGASALSTTNWSHVAGTFDGTTLRLFTNGVADGTLAVAGSADNSTNACELGALQGTANKFLGLLDEWRISNVARASSYFKAQYNNINSPSTFYTVT